MLVGDSAGDLEQVLPVLFFGIGFGQHILRRIVHAAQIAGVARIAPAPLAGRGFQQQHAAARFARHDGGAQGGIATTDDEHIGVKGFSFHDGLPSGAARGGSTWVNLVLPHILKSALFRVTQGKRASVEPNCRERRLTRVVG